MTSTDLTQLHQELTTWGASSIGTYGAKAAYLFGSLLHKNGAQFNESSDIDLVVVMPDISDASDRYRWLERFLTSKEELEYLLMRRLKRSAMEPSASVVAVTDLELLANVHKDGHREFFTANSFHDLSSAVQTTGLPYAGTSPCTRFVAGALSFVQKMRNEYFAVSANGKMTLDAYDGPDPLPKRIMRAAAMAARAIGNSSGPGAEHDVQEGLDLLTSVLYGLRDKNPLYRNLQDILSVRRRARGQYRSVELADQLLLGEIIYDIVARSPIAASAAPQPASGPRPAHSPASPKPAAPAPAPRPTNEKVETSEADAGRADVRQADVAQADGRPAEKGQTHARQRDVVVVRRPTRSSRSTTAFFAERFDATFPDVHTTSWFTDPSQMDACLLTLLQEPLTYSSGHPIWWWRGGNLQIETFRKLEENIFLMNYEELKVARIAAVPGSTFQRDFVYVETEAMPPTGLYKTRMADLASRIEQFGYDYEEYGLVSGKIPVSRHDYDEGFADIGGKELDISGRSELRLRYTTPYNFLIAANGSPINNPAFDQELVRLMNEALGGDRDSALAKIETAVGALPLRDTPNA